MAAYYNEHDKFAAAWLRNLIAANVIAPGDVDERSIEDVLPLELLKYDQCHLFAGIGVWSYGMRCAGWPDNRRAWSGSCPCQPFSQSGKGAGFADERHLWPAFYHLITQCGPDVVFGEQVASPDGLAWLNLVQHDMEAAGYALGSLDTCAAGYGAPHIRQRLYWMAHADREGLPQQRRDRRIPSGTLDALPWESAERGCTSISGVADDTGTGLERTAGTKLPWNCDGSASGSSIDGTGPANGFWRTADWLRCRDDKWRPVEPGTFPLADGATNRVGRLRGYGNAVVAPQVEEFIRIAMAFAP